MVNNLNKVCKKNDRQSLTPHTILWDNDSECLYIQTNVQGGAWQITLGFYIMCGYKLHVYHAHVQVTYLYAQDAFN